MLAVSIAATAILYLVPYGRYVAYPLMLLSTLAHEMGHGVAALLVGGSFERFLMWPDGSGVAVWSGDTVGWRLAFVAAGGLLGPAVAAAAAFAAGRTLRGARNALIVLAAVLALALLLVVRNLFGFVFVAVIALCLILVARRASAEIAQLVLVFLAVQLALSVFSRGDYLFTPVAETSAGVMPSDVGQMAAVLVLPFWVWGVACGGASILVLAYGVRSYWR
ncbi:MAG: M50 family metallopeptidase [Thermoanaerobaculia bacterium]